ncbi:MAG: mannose-1-phosphate guanylyltransferase [Deltaproteobacteria bacterium]|nr:mannose-1-phosphate guanylyltransferase [Deltaproteobacteria bacterium]
MSNATVLILAGGQGTRFWPISRIKKPKQFLSLSASGESLIEATAKRVATVSKDGELWIATSSMHRPIIAEMLPKATIICEPVGRNTAASIGLAAALLSVRNPEAVLVVLPADHAISDEKKFLATLHDAVQLAGQKDVLVTIGIKPSHPHTGYGYIKRGKKINGTGFFAVSRFFEKPNLERATEYVESGAYYWNSGMFAWRARIILEAFQRFLPALYEGLMEIKRGAESGEQEKLIEQVFPELESISIDFGILEHAQNCAVVPAEDFGWNDVGSWDAWAEHFEKDNSGNLIHGDAWAFECSNCIVHSERRFTAVVGAKDLVVIDAGDALLVCPREKVQEVRKVVEELKKSGRSDLI